MNAALLRFLHGESTPAERDSIETLTLCVFLAGVGAAMVLKAVGA